MMSWEEAKRREGLRLRAAYLKGWDSALIVPEGAANPYRRDDFARRWAFGRRDCLAGKALPVWVR